MSKKTSKKMKNQEDDEAELEDVSRLQEAEEEK